MVEPGVLLDWPVHFPDSDVSTNNHLLAHLDGMHEGLHLSSLSIHPFPSKTYLSHVD